MYYLNGTDYWECTNTPSAESVASHPEGTVAVAQRPSEDYDYTSGSWVKNSSREQARLFSELRSNRDSLLTDSDWTQVGDLVSSGAMTADKLAEWKTYRQSLRDLPANTSDPSSITWPTKPT